MCNTHLDIGQKWVRCIFEEVCVTHPLGIGQKWARVEVFLRKCKCITHLGTGQKWARGGVFLRRCKCLTHHLCKWARSGQEEGSEVGKGRGLLGEV